MNELEGAIRNLVADIYNMCVGAYGSGERSYEGQFENEIKEVVKAIKKLNCEKERG